MSLGRERLTTLSAETGFRAETLEKVDRLIGFLDDVPRHPRLSRALALKGGTALNLGLMLFLIVVVPGRAAAL